MSKISHIFSTCIIVFFLAFLLKTTFIVSNDSVQIEDISQYFSADIGKSFSLSWSTDTPFAGYRISAFDMLYSYSEAPLDYNIGEPQDGVVDIELSEGIYIFDISHPLVSYRISSPSMVLETLSSWQFYIDLTQPDEVTLLSFGATLNVSIIETLTDRLMTSMYIFPNQYLRWNPLKVSNFRNIDFLRAGQIAELYGYLNAPLYQDAIMYPKLRAIMGDQWEQLTSQVFDIFNTQIAHNTKLYQDLDTIVLFSFPGVDAISQRLAFFKNDTKKIIFYKNLILKELNTLFEARKDDPATRDKLNQHLDILASLDVHEYDAMIDLIEHYSYIVSSQWSTTQTIQKNNFTQLLSAHEGDEMIEGNMYASFDYLNAIYLSYNFESQWDHLAGISIFMKEFFWDIWVKKIDGNILSIQDTNINLRSYLSSYLQVLTLGQLKWFNASDTALDTQWLSDILDIVTYNATLASYIYFDDDSLSSNSLKQTWLYQNLNFLVILETFLANNMFESGRTQNGLLIPLLHQGMRDIVTQLQQAIDIMNQHYADHIDLLGTSRNKLASYPELSQQLDEYFIALSNYDLYRRSYETTTLDADQTQVYGWDAVDSLSIAKLKTYMSQFRWINTSAMQVEIIDQAYYQISWVYIEWLQLDFHLAPFSWNKIDAIVLNNTANVSTYVLDRIQSDLEQKFASARDEERSQYDFKNFFVNTFQPKTWWVLLDTWREPLVLEEPKFIISFKKQKLLWSWKEFDSITQVLPLEWSQVQVSENYDISIVDALYVDTSKQKRYHARLNASYDFSNTTHYFYDMDVAIYDDYISNKWSRFDLWGNEIEFIWKIYIADFESLSQLFFAQLDAFIDLYDTSSQVLRGMQYQLQYDIASQSFRLDAFAGNEIISILLSSNGTITVLNNGKNIANSVKSDTLEAILQSLL